MLDQKPLNKILFVDVETTSQKEKFSDLSEFQQSIFKKRFKKEFETKFNTWSQIKIAEETNKQRSTPKTKVTKVDVEKITQQVRDYVLDELYNEKAPILPEFGRILCISVGALWKSESDDFYNIKITSFFNEDEKILLSEFVNHDKLGIIFDRLPGKYEKNLEDFWGLCAHNGKVFDFPFIAKRLIINGFKLPALFDYAHLKPWEQTHIIDTKDEWKFGVWDSHTSLDSLCDVFDVPTPKAEMSGELVKDAYWVYNNLSGIAEYCEKDVYALAQVYLRMKSIHSEIKLYKPIVEQQPLGVVEQQPLGVVEQQPLGVDSAQSETTNIESADSHQNSNNNNQI